MSSHTGMAITTSGQSARKPAQRRSNAVDLGVILAIDGADPWQKLAAGVLREALYGAQDGDEEARHFLLTARCHAWILAILPNEWAVEDVQQRLLGKAHG